MTVLNENTIILTRSLFFEVPTASVSVEGAPALNRVRWAHSGKEIATGDSEGQVQVYDVGEVRCHTTYYYDAWVVSVWGFIIILYNSCFKCCWMCRPLSFCSKSACPRLMSGHALSGRWPRSTRTEMKPRNWPTSDVTKPTLTNAHKFLSSTPMAHYTTLASSFSTYYNMNLA